MPDPYADIAAILGGSNRFLAQDPFYQAAAQYSQVPIYSPEDKWYESLAAGLLKGAGVGALKSIGESRAGQAQADWMTGLQEAQQSPDGLSALRGNPDYSQLIAAMDSARFTEQAKQRAKQEQYAQDLMNKLRFEQKPITVQQGRENVTFMRSADPENLGQLMEVARGPKDRQQININTGEALSPIKLAEFEDKKRNELIQSSEGKALLDIEPLYESMLGVKDIDTRAADILLVSSFARINDPGSTVREGEIRVSEDAAPWFRALAGKINSALTGSGRLDFQTREEMLQASKVKVDQFRAAYDRRANRLKDIVKSQIPLYQTPEGQQRLENVFPRKLDSAMSGAGASESGAEIAPMAPQTFEPGSPITASHPETGQKLILQNGQWVPQ